MKSRQQNAGALDPSFGDAGKVIYPDNDTKFSGTARVMADGKILAIKAFEDGVSLVRFLSDGSIDKSFGDQGVVDTVLRPGIPVSSVKWQFQGAANVIVTAKLIYIENFDERVIIVRLMGDGSLDRKFGKLGIAEVPIPRVINDVYGVVVSQSGIAITMRQLRAFDVYFALIGSFTPDGQLNKNFDGGIVYSPARSYFYGDILTQSDGKIIVAGRPGGTDKLVLARYSLDGSIDAEYGNNGFFEYSESGENYLQAHGIALQPDGKVVVAGSLDNFGDSTSAGLLLRVTSDGKMDDSFNEGKAVVVSVGDQGSQNIKVAVQTDGSIVALAVTLGSADAALIRVLPTGVMDESFGEGGIVVADFGGMDIGNLVSLQSDGKLLMSATSYFDDKPSPKLTMARFIS
ncbi:MAG TPA: hypothetical protein VF671_16250 [Pseudomonas sp.]|uniref:hypothetical protein n=1 Tax=Pseudomonas sp. TaxID=306 RepID=UPI002ED83F5B